MIVKSAMILLLIPLILTAVSGEGRSPDRMDQTLCKVQLYNVLDEIQENQDPRARVEAYFNRTGYACKTYCRIRSVNKELNKIMALFDSPIYIICGPERYCAEGGKCKKIGSIIKLDHQKPIKKAVESPISKKDLKANSTGKANAKDDEEEEEEA